MSAFSPKRDSDTLLWTVPEFPVSIECPWKVLEEIHASVQEGFRAIGRGGVEVGGVLFGRRRESVVGVVAWRPIACQHACGPGFQLSERDKEELAMMLETTEEDPQLRGLEPLGFFVSHTRSSLAMTQEDLTLLDEFFPESWQSALVLRPDPNGPTRAGFFLREADGSVRLNESRREFVVQGLSFGGRQPERPSRHGAAKPGLQPVSRARLSAPRLALTPQPSSWGLATAALALVLFGTAMFALPKLMPQPKVSQTMQLRLEDDQGVLRIEWDRDSIPVREAESATLYVADSALLSPLALDRNAIQRGIITYARESNDVSVRMEIKRRGKAPLQEIARYIGPPAPAVNFKRVAEVAQSRDALLAEAERLREEIRRESERSRELEMNVRRLEAQLEREARRNR